MTNIQQGSTFTVWNKILHSLFHKYTNFWYLNDVCFVMKKTFHCNGSFYGHLLLPRQVTLNFR